MSDTSQLFAKIKISKTALWDYLNHKTGSPTELSGLNAWLQNKRWEGFEVYWDDIDDQCSKGLIVKDWLESYCSEKNVIINEPFINHYDEASQTWTLALLEFSDNIYEIITALYVLSEIKKFKDSDSDDYVIVIPYLNGEGAEKPVAVLQIKHQDSVFVEVVPQDQVVQVQRIFDFLNHERGD